MEQMVPDKMNVAAAQDQTLMATKAATSTETSTIGITCFFRTSTTAG
jgi:hypothetical protein